MVVDSLFLLLILSKFSWDISCRSCIMKLGSGLLTAKVFIFIDRKVSVVEMTQLVTAIECLTKLLI